MNFSEKLQKLRKSGGYSQEELANELNVSRQAISKWEQGTVPDINNLLSISRFFDCSLDYLLNDAYEEIKDKTAEDNVAFRRPTDMKLLLSSLGMILPILGFILIYVLSLVSKLSFVRTVDNRNIYYSGIRAFIEYHFLNALIIAQSVLFLISYVFFSLRIKQKKEPTPKRTVFFYIGLIMITALVVVAVITLITGGSIILDDITCILISIYTCCALLLNYFKLGGN